MGDRGSAGPISRAVAHNVRRLREERGLHQARLGERMAVVGEPVGLAEHGWSRLTVQGVEAGVRPIRVDELPLLCGALEVTLDRLLDLSDLPDPHRRDVLRLLHGDRQQVNVSVFRMALVEALDRQGVQLDA